MVIFSGTLNIRDHAIAGTQEGTTILITYRMIRLLRLDGEMFSTFNIQRTLLGISNNPYTKSLYTPTKQEARCRSSTSERQVTSPRGTRQGVLRSRRGRSGAWGFRKIRGTFVEGYP